MDIHELVETWSKYKDNRRNEIQYFTDIDFIKHFKLVDQQGYISSIFEVLLCEYGFERTIQYEFLLFSNNPVLINFTTHEMSNLTDSSCPDIQYIIENHLTIMTEHLIITSSEYLKPICVLLFSQCRHIEGLSYTFANLIPIISCIIPYHIKVIKHNESETLSLPFTISFLEYLPFDFKIDKYHSQIENKIYKVNNEAENIYKPLQH
nr:hypothetical protein MmNV_52 [Menippe mercenaria nudivirus]